MRDRLAPWIWAVLAIPYLGLLFPSFYNLREPALFGFPFFYWYQMLWTVLGALCIVPVYLHEERRK